MTLICEKPPFASYRTFWLDRHTYILMMCDFNFSMTSAKLFLWETDCVILIYYFFKSLKFRDNIGQVLSYPFKSLKFFIRWVSNYRDNIEQVLSYPFKIMTHFMINFWLYIIIIIIVCQDVFLKLLLGVFYNQEFIS